MRKVVYFLLTGALLLGLTACARGTAVRGGLKTFAPAPTQTVEVPPTPTPTPTPTPAPTPVPIPSLEPVIIETADIPAGNYAPWQGAYVRFLEELRGEEAAFELWYDELPIQDRWDQKVSMKIAMHSDSYWLYDIDENGIPELMIQYGNCEAAYYTYCYTYREGEVVCIGDFECGHTSLWSWPGENGMLQFFYGVEHMFTIVDGELRMGGHQFDIPEGYYEEKGLDWTQHPDPADFIPGSEYIPNHRILADSGNRKSPVLALPIYDYEALPWQREQVLEESAVRSAIGRVLWGGQEFFCHSGDGWQEFRKGYISLEEYLRTGGNHYYGEDSPLTAETMAWADGNGDGQIDCILWLTRSEGERTVTDYILFSAEADGIHAYGFSYIDGFGVTPNGTVYIRDDERWYRMSFYKNQSCCYFVQAPEDWDDLAWEEFSPAE